MEIKNEKTSNIIVEVVDYRGNGKKQERAGIKALIEIFKRSKEEDFQDESEKVTGGCINMILGTQYEENSDSLQKLCSIFRQRPFLCDETALQNINASGL